MRILLTSFGISESLPNDRAAGHFEMSPGHMSDVALDGREASLYYRMPPVDMRAVNKIFMPDYASLLLADKLVMDEQSFLALQHNRHPLYRGVSQTLEALHGEGHVELVDFDSALNTQSDILDKMLELDMRILDEWVAPLRTSLDAWIRFVYRTRESLASEEPAESDADFAAAGMFHTMVHHIHGTKVMADMMLQEALDSSRNRRKKEYRDVLRQTIRPYLHHVNCNLVLSHQFSAGFHDWADFLPFYERKFLPIGQSSVESERHAQQVRRLFTVPFPELAIRNTSQLIKAVNDKRIMDLRGLISDAAAGNVAFDEEFAKRTLTEVLKIEKRSKRWRNITSYITIPIGQIPWVGSLFQKAVEEAAGRMIDSRMQKDYRWYYLLSDVVDTEEAA